MSIFSKIKDKIFGRKAEAATPATPAAQTPAIPLDQPAAAPAPAAISEVDVMANLAGMTGADSLNWRTSIVDLLKLVGIESSYENRKELALELGNASYSGSAEDNMALHRQVMRELAENGGKVPADLLD